MDYFYIVTPESKLWKEIKHYEKCSLRFNDLYKQFAEEHEIETTQYIPSTDRLIIYAPTDNDREKFTDQFVADARTQKLITCHFTKTSKMGKAWKAFVKKHQIESVRYPEVRWHFEEFYESCHKQLFEYKETIYLHISTNNDKLNPPKGFVVLKGSEYYKVFEEYEAAKDKEVLDKLKNPES